MRFLCPNVKIGAELPRPQSAGADKGTSMKAWHKELTSFDGLYDANNDPELLSLRNAAKDLCWEINGLKPSDEENRRRLLRVLLGKTGEHFTILPSFWCDYGSNIVIGENFFANHNLVILDGATVTFGDNVFIGPNCGFYTAGHPIDYERRNAGLEYARPIHIGNNVWIGAGAQILPGVTIGDNTVIGAGSVVTKNIPADCVAFGNPCKVFRPITDADRLPSRL